VQMYYGTRKAADYCGYSYETFRKIIREYQLPKYGPRRNRFSVHDLDEFMVEPEQFTVQSNRKAGRRKPITLKP